MKTSEERQVIVEVPHKSGAGEAPSASCAEIPSFLKKDFCSIVLQSYDLSSSSSSSRGGGSSSSSSLSSCSSRGGRFLAEQRQPATIDERNNNDSSKARKFLYAVCPMPGCQQRHRVQRQWGVPLTTTGEVDFAKRWPVAAKNCRDQWRRHFESHHPEICRDDHPVAIRRVNKRRYIPRLENNKINYAEYQRRLRKEKREQNSRKQSGE